VRGAADVAPFVRIPEQRGGRQMGA